MIISQEDNSTKILAIWGNGFWVKSMLEYDSYLFLEKNSTPLYTNPTPENYDLNKPESTIAGGDSTSFSLYGQVFFEDF